MQRTHARTFAVAVALLSAIVISGLPSAAMAQCEVLLQPAGDFSAGPWARYPVVGDFNEDGLSDLAVPVGAPSTYYGAGSGVAILLGVGGGAFAAPVTYAAGTTCSQIAAGDFNADGITDLAVASKGNSSDVTILIGQGAGGVGDGTFGPPASIPVAGNPFSIVAADFDRDGITDLATCVNFGAAVVLLKGLGSDGVGNGSFAPVGSIPIPGTSSGLATGDFNHDGVLDLVATQFTHAALTVAFGTGSVPLSGGSFALADNVPVLAQPFVVAVADLNADSYPDLIVGHSASHGIKVLLGSATGAFTPGVTLSAGNVSGVTTADLDHDGHLDIATGIVTGSNSGIVEIYRGHGDGTFGVVETYRPYRDCYAIIAADLDADGVTDDLAVAEGYGSNVGVLLGACSAPCTEVPVSLDLTPNTFNLKSLGHWVTGVLEPEPPASPADIDIGSIRLNGSVPVDPSAPTAIGDDDGDGRPDLMVKFDRAAVEATLTEGDSVTVTVTGSIGSCSFEATDVVKVRRGHVTSPAAASVVQSGANIELSWETPNSLQVQSAAVLFSGDDGASWSLEAHELPNSGRYDWTAASASTNQARIAVVLVEQTVSGEYVVEGVLSVSDRFTVTSALGTPDGGLELALRPIANPSTDLGVSFTLPDHQPATLVAYDVSGREVSRRDVSGMGRHVIALGADARLVPGAYVVQLIQGQRRRTARAVVIR
jgi:hypothetical protein